MGDQKRAAMDAGSVRRRQINLLKQQLEKENYFGQFKELPRQAAVGVEQHGARQGIGLHVEASGPDGGHAYVGRDRRGLGSEGREGSGGQVERDFGTEEPQSGRQRVLKGQCPVCRKVIGRGLHFHKRKCERENTNWQKTQTISAQGSPQN